MTQEADTNKKICLGVIVGSHGVHGRVKIKAYTQDPKSVGAYGPVETAQGSFPIKVTGVSKGVVIAALEGVRDRTQSDAMRGVSLFVSREALGEDEEEDSFFHADLVGLRAMLASGEFVGEVVGVHDFGAGDLLEIKLVDGRLELMPFTKDNVPEIRFDARDMIIDPPAGLFDAPKSKNPKRRRSPKSAEKMAQKADEKARKAALSEELSKTPSTTEVGDSVTTQETSGPVTAPTDDTPSETDRVSGENGEKNG